MQHSSKYVQSPFRLSIHPRDVEFDTTKSLKILSNTVVQHIWFPNPEAYLIDLEL